jgi:hypothetical protein
MLLGAALRAGTGLQGWGAENVTLHRRLQLGKGTAPSPEVFMNRCYQKRKIAVLFYNPCMACETHDRLETEVLGIHRCGGGAIAIQKLKDSGTRIEQLQHAEKLLERATSFRLSGNESKSVSEGK